MGKLLVAEGAQNVAVGTVILQLLEDGEGADVLTTPSFKRCFRDSLTNTSLPRRRAGPQAGKH